MPPAATISRTAIGQVLIVSAGRDPSSGKAFTRTTIEPSVAVRPVKTSEQRTVALSSAM